MAVCRHLTAHIYRAWPQTCFKFKNKIRAGLIRGEQMNTSTTDEIGGALYEVKGKVKETVGRTINNPKLVGQVEQVFEK
jgi:hypothetical protein